MTLTKIVVESLALPSDSPHREALEKLVTESETLLRHYTRSTVARKDYLHLGSPLHYKEAFIAFLGRAVLSSENVNIHKFIQMYPELARELVEKMKAHFLPTTDSEAISWLDYNVERLAEPDYTIAGKEYHLWQDRTKEAAQIIGDFIQTGGAHVSLYLVGRKDKKAFGSGHTFHMNSDGSIADWEPIEVGKVFNKWGRCIGFIRDLQYRENFAK